MISETLSLIAKGGLSVEEMAKKLGIPKDSLVQRFDELVRKGYLKTTEDDPTCVSGKCANCPMTRSCTGSEEYPRFYEMTSKGKRAIGLE